MMPLLHPYEGLRKEEEDPSWNLYLLIKCLISQSAEYVIWPAYSTDLSVPKFLEFSEEQVTSQHLWKTVWITGMGTWILFSVRNRHTSHKTNQTP